ncbi:MAG TPA: alpha/beta fold hydrolase [Gemmatimonadaceae bacterium]|nr:alpha/beta fold hydrolase [Gemmatimonadaceae bacterium]
MRALLAAISSLAIATPSLHAQPRPGDFTLPEYRFESGEVLPRLRLHYLTLGTPRRDATGTVANAVMILHGTGGTGAQFLGPGFAGALYGKGQPLDTTRFFIVLPDNIGHGQSSKPSDGLHMRFPHYGYTDMVKLQRLLLSQGLGVERPYLIMGTSMGCMHAWVWGTLYPEAPRALVPLACVPTQIAGRNRMMRRMIMDAITQDPEWSGGEYTAPPRGLRAALGMLFMMSSAPLVQQAQAPTRDAADSVIRAYLDARMKVTDANDMLYQFDASRDYDPSPLLDRVVAPVLHINSADDQVNPPELKLAETLIAKVKRARFVMIPISDRTRGHGTHTMPAIWGDELRRFMATLPPVEGGK